MSRLTQNFHVSQIYRLMGGNGTPIEIGGVVKHQANSTIELGALLTSDMLGRKDLAARAMHQYDPRLHEVASPQKRKDKVVFVPNGQKDEITGEDKLVMNFVPPARVPLQIQKYIIKQKASFARGNGVKLRPSNEKSEVFSWVHKNWYANKTDYFLGEIFRRWKAETQVAVVYFGDPSLMRGTKNAQDFRLRFKILSPSKGDYLYPFFDPETESLTALLREYEDEKGKTVFDMYIEADPENNFPNPIIRRFRKDDLETFTDIVLPYPKLPLVYWGDDYVEFEDSSAAIQELENGFSDFLTQMGYSADPILFGKGKALNMPAKGSAGKFIEGSEDSDLKFVTPENATESRDLQFKLLQKYIFSLNRAVILDLDAMKNLSDVSGAALDRYLIDAYLEATDNQTGYWGLGVQRMCNIQVAVAKDILGVEDTVDDTVDVEFTPYRINDVRETVEVMLLANGRKPLIDHQASISAANLADDPAVAFERIKEETPADNGQTTQAAIAQAQAGALGDNGDPAV